MSKKNNPDAKLISECESLLVDSNKIKARLDLFDIKKSSEDAFDGICRDYREWLSRAGRIAGKQYTPLITSRLAGGDGGTATLIKARSTMTGDIICIEDDIRRLLIQCKGKTNDVSRLIADLILKEWKGDKELKEMLEVILSSKTGKMARYIYDNNLGGENPKEKYVPVNLEQLKHLYEINFKDKLKEALRKKFSKKFSDVDFDVAYLEARDELSGGDKKQAKIISRDDKVVEDSSFEYELLFSGKKRKLLTVQRAEQIRNRKGTGAKNEIFIDDERKDVFFNKNFLKDFRHQHYAMLLYFVENEGIGGDFLRIYDNLWEAHVAEDKVKGVVETAVSRFRIKVEKNGMGSVPWSSKNSYSISKTYIMKPKPKYCVLKKIEKEKKEE